MIDVDALVEGKEKKWTFRIQSWTLSLSGSRLSGWIIKPADRTRKNVLGAWGMANRVHKESRKEKEAS